MFLHLSVSHSVHRGWGVYPNAYWDTPLVRHPLVRHPLGRHPPGQTPPWADSPPGQTSLGRHPLGRHPPRQTPPGTQSTGMHSCYYYISYWLITCR